MCFAHPKMVKKFMRCCFAAAHFIPVLHTSRGEKDTLSDKPGDRRKVLNFVEKRASREKTGWMAATPMKNVSN